MARSQSVRAEIVSTSVIGEKHADPVLSRFVARVSVAHERSWITCGASLSQTVFVDDNASGVRVCRKEAFYRLRVHVSVVDYVSVSNNLRNQLEFSVDDDVDCLVKPFIEMHLHS